MRRRWWEQEGEGGYAGQPGGGGNRDGKNPLGQLCHFPHPLQLMLQSFSHQEEVKQPHCKDSQEPAS